MGGAGRWQAHFNRSRGYWGPSPASRDNVAKRTSASREQSAYQHGSLSSERRLLGEYQGLTTTGAPFAQKQKTYAPGLVYDVCTLR